MKTKAAGKRAAKKAAQNSAKKAAQKAAREPHPQAFYRINALLHTMRTIGQHEEQLCIIMTEIKKAGTVSPALRRELRSVLEEIPSWAYQSDLDAVRQTLTSPANKTSITRR